MADTVIDPTKDLGASATVTKEDSYEKRKEAFGKEVNAVGDKYIMGLTAKINVTNDGIIPVLSFVDRKPLPKPPKQPQDRLPKKK